MYTFIVVFQALCIMIAVITTISILRAKPMQAGKYLYITMAGTTIQSIGYFLEIVAKDQGSALTAVKMEYIGLCIGFMMLLMYVFTVCHIKPPKFLFPVLILINFTTIALVLTCEYHSLYYSWISYSTDDWLYPHLVFGRGPQYWIHMCTMVFMIVTVLSVSIRRYSITAASKKKDYSFLKMLVSFGILAILLLAGYLTGFFGFYDPTPVMLLLICLFVRFNIFDISQSAMEVVVNTIKESIILVDENYRFLECNAEAYTVFPELVQCFAGTSINEVSPLLDELILHRSSREFSVGDRYYQSHVNDIIGKGKAVVGHVACIIDVTESHINIKQIISMKNKADIANRAKSEFLTNVSHEIRTPMNAILGMVELAMKEDINENVRNNLIDIKAAGNTLLALISDILDFSKIESKKMEIVNEPYSFSSLISDTMNIISVRNKPSVELRQDIDPTIPSVLIGDMPRIRQVMLNFLTNATKFTESGYIELSVHWRKYDNKAALDISVTDTGIGITQENIKKLFTSFQRVDSRKNRSIEGAGLGLAISKQLVSLMGGDVSVMSVYGEGSTFSVSIPQEIKDESPCGYDPKLLTHTIMQKAFEHSFTAPEAKVLVVDDNPVNLKIARGFLKPYGLDVDTAINGQDCLNKISNKRYDIAFLDYMMPILDGIDTLQLIRAKKIEDEYFAKVPVIALTADAVSGAREKFCKVGFADYIPKPISPARLEEVLIKYLPIDFIKELSDDDAVKDTSEKDAKIIPDIKIENVEIELGVENCGGDYEDYIQVLDIFKRHGASKVDKIKELYLDGDIENYTIEVHSLKSSTANIGALGVSKLARDLEKAGKDDDREFIKANTDELLRQLKELLSNVDKALEKLDK